MTARSSALVFITSAAITLAISAESALADVKRAQCIDANTKAQDLRRDGKLSEARNQLRTCGDPSCPAMVRDDCTKRLTELEAAQPTVVFDAKDGSGHDLSAVAVTMDGHPFADNLDGKALPVDPGEHEFTFTVAEQAPVTEKLVINESEKGRHEHVLIGHPPPPIEPPPPPPSPPPPPPSPTGLGTQKVVAIVAGGAGVAGVAVGSVFGLLTASAISQQKTDCTSPTICPHPQQAASDHATWTTDSTISTATFIAGGVLLAAGAVLWFTAHPPSEEPGVTGLMVVPSVRPGGGGMLVRGEF
jgi:hypothetical protein